MSPYKTPQPLLGWEGCLQFLKARACCSLLCLVIVPLYPKLCVCVIFGLWSTELGFQQHLYNGQPTRAETGLPFFTAIPPGTRTVPDAQSAPQKMLAKWTNTFLSQIVLRCEHRCVLILDLSVTVFVQYYTGSCPLIRWLESKNSPIHLRILLNMFSAQPFGFYVLIELIRLHSPSK